MAHFYGTIKGQRGQASRLGSAKSGLEVRAASYSGAVAVWLHEVAGVTIARVELDTHHGAGVSRVLYDGPVSGGPASTVEAR